MGFQQFIFVVWEKSRLNLKSEASINYLSYMWWILEPILLMIGYYFLFGVVLDRGEDNFIHFLLIGLVPWLWFSRSINQSSQSLIQGRGIMNQISIPKAFFPMVILVQCLVKQFLVFIILLVYLYLSGVQASSSWFFLPFLVLIQFVLIVSLGMISAYLVTIVRDLKNIIPMALQFLFLFSGIFYDLTNLSDEYSSILLLNPIANLISSYRLIILDGGYPETASMFTILVTSMVLCIIIFTVYSRSDKRIARLVLQ